MWYTTYVRGKLIILKVYQLIWICWHKPGIPHPYQRRGGKKKKQKKPLSWLAKETGVIAKAIVTEFHPICLKAHHRESARHFKEGVEPDTDRILLWGRGEQGFPQACVLSSSFLTDIIRESECSFTLSIRMKTFKRHLAICQWGARPQISSGGHAHTYSSLMEKEKH